MGQTESIDQASRSIHSSTTCSPIASPGSAPGASPFVYTAASTNAASPTSRRLTRSVGLEPEEERVDPFLNLTPALILRILSFCDEYDVTSMEMCSCRMRQICISNTLWKGFYRKHFAHHGHFKVEELADEPVSREQAELNALRGDNSHSGDISFTASSGRSAPSNARSDGQVSATAYRPKTVKAVSWKRRFLVCELNERLRLNKAQDGSAPSSQSAHASPSGGAAGRFSRRRRAPTAALMFDHMFGGKRVLGGSAVDADFRCHYRPASKLSDAEVTIVFCGPRRSGKTAIIQRFMRNEFSDVYETTIGARFQTRKLELEERMVRVNVWDTGGQERFRPLIPMYVKAANVVCVISDCSDAEARDEARAVLADLMDACPPNVLVLFVSNKTDLLGTSSGTASLTLDDVANENMELLQSMTSAHPGQPMLTQHCSAKQSDDALRELFAAICEAHAQNVQRAHRISMIEAKSNST